MNYTDVIRERRSIRKYKADIDAVGVADEEPAARGFFDPERVTYL